MIEYGKSDYGLEFPLYQGELLSWSIGLYHTHTEEQAGFPRMGTVIRAMMERRPEQLQHERQELVRDSFNPIFGHNARKQLEIVESETQP